MSVEEVADEIHAVAAAIKPSINPIGCVFSPRFLHRLRDKKTQQGQRNQSPPAERTAGLDRDAQHFRIDQRPCPLNPRCPLHDGPLAGPIARKGGCSCADDGDQQERRRPLRDRRKWGQAGSIATRIPLRTKK